MLPPMHASIAFALLLMLATVASAQAIYKYQDADGKTTYSSQPQRGVAPVETFDHRYAPAVAPDAADAKAGAALDERLKLRVAALDRAWVEVRVATASLEVAEARLAAGVGAEEGEAAALAGPDLVVVAPVVPGESAADAAAAAAAATAKATSESVAVGGTQIPATPAAGGPGPAASPAVGGPMGTRRGGGRNVAYQARLAGLQAEVAVARARLEVALRDYHKLR